VTSSLETFSPSLLHIGVLLVAPIYTLSSRYFLFLMLGGGGWSTDVSHAFFGICGLFSFG
jgi:hypothetical protein